MPTTEETQYSMVCKERFDHISRKVDDIHKVIVGDGQDGIAGRLIRVEEQVTAQKSRWRYMLGILAVVIAAVIINYIMGL